MLRLQKSALLFIILLSGLILPSQLLAAPVAEFIASPTQGCAPIRIVFTDQSTGNPVSWSWDLGNGTLSSVQSPSTTYFNAGVYTIKLTVTDATGATNTITKTNYVTIYGIPDVNLEATPKTGCYPLPVQFTDLTTGGGSAITAWQWDFGDGIINNTQNPSHTYTANGLFNITLTATNANGCKKTITKPNYVQIFDGVIANFRFSSVVPCQVPATVTFTDLSTGNGINSWFWDFGDGTTSTLQNPIKTYNASGRFVVKLTVRNTSGCVNTFTNPLVVSVGLVTADFTFPIPVCANTNFQFINQSSPNGQFSWDFGDGTTSNAVNPFKRYTAPGTYTVTLRNDFTGCGDSKTKTVTVVEGTGGDFTGTNLNTCKPPLTASFNSNGTVVKWYFGDGDSSTLASPTHTYTKFGSFTVTLIVRTANGCLQRVVKPGFVRIAPPEITSIKNLDYHGCIPWTNTFEAIINTPDPVVTYEWDLGNGIMSNLQNPSATYTVEGRYIVKLKITTAIGCTDTISALVEVGHPPTPNFSANPLKTCPQFTVMFTDLSTGGPITRYRWLFGDGGTSSDPNPRYYYNDTGWMNVTLQVENFGCRTSITFNKYIYISPPIASFKDSVECVDQKMHYFRDKSIGALFWSWQFGDGDVSTIPSPTHLYRDTGTYTVKLTVRDTACEHSSTQKVYVLDEKADFITQDSVGCSSTKKKFTAFGPKTHPWNIKYYWWDFGDTTVAPILDSTGVISYTFSKSGTYNIKLKIQDLNGCLDSISKPITVAIYGPIANFGPEGDTLCFNTPFTFFDSSNGNGNTLVKWTWDYGDNIRESFSTNGPFNHTYTKGGTYDVKLIIEDNAGCKDSLLKGNFIFIAQPKVDFYSPDTVVCLNTNVRFFPIFSSVAPLARLRWTFGDGDTSFFYSPSHIYTAEGRYTISLKAEDGAGCIDSLIKPLYILVANAKANFVLSDSFSSCPPLLVSFTNNSINNLNSYWDFGNGNTSNLINPSHTYTFPGVFNVVLRVTGNGGCEDKDTAIVRIKGPFGDIKYDPFIGCSPLTVKFSSKATNTKFYTWDYQDGVTKTGLDTFAIYDYKLLGQYLPKVILEDSLGCKLPIQGKDTIFVKGIDTKIKQLPKYLFCDSTIISFFDTTITNDIIRSYKWHFGDGDSSSLQNPVHKFKTAGLFNTTFTVTTINGCTDTDTLTPPVKIVLSPKVSFLPDTFGCAPFTIQYFGQWNNPDTSTMAYKWDFGNNTTSTQLNPSQVVYNNVGVYNILFTAKSASGCTDTVTKVLNVYGKPTIDATSLPFVCLGSGTPLNASGALTYVWDPHPTLSCLNCQQPIASPIFPTTYKVTGTDTNGCKNIDTISVDVQYPLTMTNGPGDTLCIGESFILRAAGAEVYSWTPISSLNNPTSATPIAKPTETTIYRVIGGDRRNCFYDTAYINVVVFPIPKFDILQDKIEIPIGSSVQLQSTSSPDVIKWRWRNNPGLTCYDCPNPIAEPKTRVTTYECTATNEGACYTRDQVTIITICTDGNIFVPNTFSPNADGANDVFMPRGKGLYAIKSMRIFDRWGELVFEKTNFLPNDANQGWDGTYRGKKLTPDVYVYIMEIICDNTHQFNMKGNVTLLK